VRLKISTLALKSNPRQVTFPTRNYCADFFLDAGQLILTRAQSKLFDRLAKNIFYEKVLDRIALDTLYKTIRA